MFAITQPIRKEAATYVQVSKVINNQTCDEIVALSKAVPAQAGMQGRGPEKRLCDVHWINWVPTGGVNSLYQKLADVVHHMNAQFWDFHLAGFMEPLQLTHYSAPGGHYDWHADRGDQGIQMNRKISGTLLLSDDFDGGDFELFDTPPIQKMGKGDLILFPSFHVHKVHPVDRGERWSLVFWVTGPPFA